MHNILIVDDEDRDIKMLAMLLEHNFSEEYQVFFATSALEAFSEIKEYSPTLMFVDIKMPRMNGIELLNLIRGNKSIKNIYTDYICCGCDRRSDWRFLCHRYSGTDS